MFTAVKKLYFAAAFYDTDLAEHKNVKRCLYFSIRESISSFFNSLSLEDDDSSLLQKGIYKSKQKNIISFKELFDFKHDDYRLIKLSKKIIRLLLVLLDNQLSGFR